VVLRSCPTRIFLPNPGAATEEVAALYRAYGLNDREVEIVAGGESKRDYFFQSPDGSRRFDLRLGPVALAFLGSRPGLTTAAAVEEARRLEALHGAGWPRAWLADCGVPAESIDVPAPPAGDAP
jgi:type IV secretion system protein VirB4